MANRNDPYQGHPELKDYPNTQALLNAVRPQGRTLLEHDNMLVDQYRNPFLQIMQNPQMQQAFIAYLLRTFGAPEGQTQLPPMLDPITGPQGSGAADLRAPKPPMNPLQWLFNNLLAGTNRPGVYSPEAFGKQRDFAPYGVGPFSIEKMMKNPGVPL